MGTKTSIWCAIGAMVVTAAVALMGFIPVGVAYLLPAEFFVLLMSFVSYATNEDSDEFEYDQKCARRLAYAIILNCTVKLCIGVFFPEVNLFAGTTETISFSNLADSGFFTIFRASVLTCLVPPVIFVVAYGIYKIGRIILGESWKGAKKLITA